MRIQGDLATYELSDLLQWLAQGHKTGTLVVRGAENEYRIGFDQGWIDMSASSDPETHLDRFLLRKGLIDDATVARAARLRTATQMLSGQVLVTLGALTQEQLADAMRQKTEEILCELLTWNEGSFEFLDERDLDDTQVPIRLDVTKLLLESMHRLDQRQQERGGTSLAGPPVEAQAGLETGAPTEVAPAVEPQPDAESLPAVEPEPVTAVTPPVIVPPSTGEVATEGLALAAVLDPESAPEPSAQPPVTEESGSEPAVHYAAMAHRDGALRRMVPFLLVAVASLSAAGFYLVSRQADAQPAKARGKPILFTRLEAPPPPIALAGGPALVTPEVTEAALPPLESDEALRARYERELAGLRDELAAVRRQAAERKPGPLLKTEPPGAAPVNTPAAARAQLEPTAERVAASRAEPEPPAAAASVPASLAAPPAASSSATGDQPVPAQPVPVPAATRAPSPAAPAEPRPTPPRASEPPATAQQEEPPPAREATADAAVSEPEQPISELQRPALIERPMPRYPAAARRHGLGASVTVRVFVGADGSVQEVERVGPKAGMGFDRAAEEAALVSTWVPGTRNGVAEPMWTELRFEFKP